MTMLALPAAQGLATINDLNSFTDAWLTNRDLAEATRTAYRRDLTVYLTWCATQQLDPLTAQFTHLNAYSRWLDADQHLAPRSRARAMSAVSSWYRFLGKLGLAPNNPAADADRPKIDRWQTVTVGFTAAQGAAMVAVAGTDLRLGGACASALVAFLVTTGCRVAEACRADVGDLSHDAGHRTVTLRMKGGKVRSRVIPPQLGRVVDAFLATRPTTVPTDPLFADRDGGRLDTGQVYRLVRRTAKTAGFPGWERITPHSFRHAWATIAREAGSPLEARQHALGHADPRTTEAYDRARLRLDHDPAYLVAAVVAAV